LPVDQQLILWLLALPVAAAIIVASLGPKRGPFIRLLSFLTSVAVLVLAVTIAVRFMALTETRTRAVDLSKPTFAPEFVPGSTDSEPRWELLNLGKGAVHFYLGIDGLNLWLIVLTAVLFVPSVLVSWTHVSERVNEFFAWLLALQTCVIGVFLAFDIVLFYVFFELSLVPLFFLIGIWGGPMRQDAAKKFFLYTFTGSLLSLLGILGIVLAVNDRTNILTFSIPRLVELVHAQLDNPDTKDYWTTIQYLVFVLMTCGFAVKVPLLPFHTWLPLAHTEAPTAGSVDLAGILLKIGAYGFLRLCIPLAPDVSLSLGLPLVATLAAAGIIYGSLCAYGQDDVKRLVAYSSVAHLGLCMLGMFALNAAGLQGSIMQMINHGLSTGMLFLMIGMLYERYHTRKLNDYSGMATRLPYFGVFLVFACLSSVGLPGLNGFIGEILCLFGIVEHEKNYGRHGFVLTTIAATGMLLGALYLFTMLRRVLFGPLKEPGHHGDLPITDLKPREWLLLAPIVVLCFFLGVYPKPVLDTSQPDVNRIVNIADKARERAGVRPASVAETDSRPGRQD
jgi:NADH-quinone oxidoreductase subunit M